VKENLLDFKEGWSKVIADLQEPKTFRTIGKRTKFTIYCANGKIMFQSPYKGCKISETEMKKVHQRFIEKRSWKTNDYTDITVHASYFLRFGRNYGFVDEKPDNLTSIHNKTILKTILNYAHP
jgi:hypothetical protein